MPILEWLPAYRRAWLPGDLVAGAAVWAVLDQLVDLLPGALAIVVLGYTKSLGALKRAHAAERGSRPIDPDRELLSIGAANIAAGLSGGYPVAGSLSATAVRIDTGGSTQVGNLFAGLLGVLTILFLLPALAREGLRQEPTP